MEGLGLASLQRVVGFEPKRLQAFLQGCEFSAILFSLPKLDCIIHTHRASPCKSHGKHLHLLWSRGQRLQRINQLGGHPCPSVLRYHLGVVLCGAEC